MEVSALDDSALPFVEDGQAEIAPEFSEEELPYVEEITENTPQITPFSEEELPFIEPEEVIAPLSDTSIADDIENDIITNKNLNSKDVKGTIISSVSNTMFFIFVLIFFVIIGLIVYFSRQEQF